MSRTIVLKPQASEKVSQLLKYALSMEIQESKLQSYFEYVLRRLYKNYQQKMEAVYYEFLSHVEKWHIEWFVKSFEWRNKNFMVKVCHISFPNLKTLTLSNLEIMNVQFLAWMDYPCLETLNLSHNGISSLKPLSKTDNKKLENIYLENNPFSFNELLSFQNRGGLNLDTVSSMQVGKEFKFTAFGAFMKMGIQNIEGRQVEFELLSQKVRLKLKQKFKSI